MAIKLEGGGKALMAWPLGEEFFFAASLSSFVTRNSCKTTQFLRSYIRQSYSVEHRLQILNIYILGNTLTFLPCSLVVMLMLTFQLYIPHSGECGGGAKVQQFVHPLIKHYQRKGNKKKLLTCLFEEKPFPLKLFESFIFVKNTAGLQKFQEMFFDFKYQKNFNSKLD